MHLPPQGVLMKSRPFLLLAVLFSLSACSTVAVNRAEGVSESAISYVDSLKKVNELALDKSIDFTADLLLSTPRTLQNLNDKTKDINERIRLAGEYKNYLDQLGNYFTELNALANGDQSENTAKAIDKIVENLKQPPAEIKISDERKAALSGLSAVVAKQIHATKVQSALERHADIVAQALEISEKLLDEQISWISIREKARKLKDYKSAVEGPYTSNPPITLDDSWKNAWKASVSDSEVIQVLNDSKKASKALQKEWLAVLRGQYSPSELQSILKELKSGIDAIALVKNTK